MYRQQCSFANSISWILKVVTLTATLLVAVVFAQNPVPQIVGPVKPMAVAPGSGAFTLSVYGANFVSGAVVNWNRQPRSTTLISAHELQAQILASDVVKNTAGLISVTNPPPGGGNSSTGWAQVEVHAPISTVTVSAPTAYPLGFWLLMAADFNNDGILDLVGQGGVGLEFYAGTKRGIFHFGSVAGYGYPGVVPGAYGDFDNDGSLDLIYPTDVNVNSNQPTRMTVMLGDGNGRFQLGTQLRDEMGFGLTTVGDFNGDGKLDLVTKGQRRFSVFLGNGDGTFRRFQDYPNGDLIGEMAAGDFNGDGKLDLLLLQAIPNSNDAVVLKVMLGNGDGTFQKPREIHRFAKGRVCGGNVLQDDFQLSDFNGDGNLDVALCTDTQIVVLLGNGDATFQPPLFVDAGTQGLFTYAVGDINSDGKPDLIVSQYPGFSSMIAVFLGNGDGTFQPAQIVASGIPFGELGIVAGDFNSDGLLDFIFQTGGGSQVFVQK